MRRVLKSKWHMENKDVTHVWANIPDFVSPDEAWNAVERAVNEVIATIDHPDRVVYGWSGGKDSLALQVVMDIVGIRRAVMGIIPAFEWHQYLDWTERHRPEGLEVIANNRIDMAYLARYPHLIFPRNSRHGYWWTLAGIRYAQHAYQERHKPSLQIYGRRRADNNSVSSRSDGVHTTRRLRTYAPLRDWSHELTLAVVYYAGLELPPIYDWPHGWTAGTGPWPKRRVGTREESWAETWAIEPDRVREAADVLPGAREWMDQHGYH